MYFPCNPPVIGTPLSGQRVASAPLARKLKIGKNMSSWRVGQFGSILHGAQTSLWRVFSILSADKDTSQEVNGQQTLVKHIVCCRVESELNL